MMRNKKEMYKQNIVMVLHNYVITRIRDAPYKRIDSQYISHNPSVLKDPYELLLFEIF